jgi:transposase InsO family protein
VEATIRKLLEYFTSIRNQKGDATVMIPENERHFKAPWMYMRIHVKQFIKECPTCQKLDQRNPKITVEPFTNASYAWPMEDLNVDTIGPYPESSDGYKHILVIIDRMSRYVNIFPLKTTESREAVLSLLKHIAIFRKPKILRSDGGSQFANQLLEELLRMLGTEYQQTLAYSKEENAIVERANKTVVHHLRAFMQEPILGQNWPDYLPMIQRLMNTMVHTSHKFTPVQIVFGARFDDEGKDTGLCVPISDEHVDEIPVRHIINKDVKAWLTIMRNVQEKIIEVAKQNQKQLDAKHLEQRGKDTEEYSIFPPDTYVLVRYPKTAMGRKAPTKLHSPWKGPMKVIRNEGNRYYLLNLVNMKEEQAHVTALKTFEYNRNIDPREIALKEANAFDVERILSHRCKHPNRISTYELLVKWLGYDDSQNTWEPWENLRNNEATHHYLREHGLQRFIPKRYMT